MSHSASPLEDIRQLIRTMPDADEHARRAVQAREAQLIKPAGALGRMEEISAWFAAWSGQTAFTLNRPMVCVFAGNHGVAARGVSAYPPSVTAQMVEAFASGGAAINQFCAGLGAGLKVFDLALDHPTPDIAVADAFEPRACAASIAFGMEALAEQPTILCLGEMGIGNTTVAAALSHGLFGGQEDDWVGPGTGVQSAALMRKRHAVRDAVARVRVPSGATLTGLDALCRLSGREFAAIAGAIIAARHQRVPVILDGYAVSAAAACLFAERTDALDHCLFAHVSAEPGHRRLLDRMGVKPLLDLDLRLGEGTGAALGLAIVKLALSAHMGMATFADMGIDGPQDHPS